MDRFNAMQAFARVVESGSFTKAAHTLRMSRTTVTLLVQQLEARLRVKLLHRTTRKLSLTDVGEAYLRHCQAVRESAQAAADAVAQVQTEPRGTLRVSCPVILGVCDQPLLPCPETVEAVQQRTLDAQGRFTGGRNFNSTPAFTFTGDEISCGSVIVYQFTDTTATAFAL